LNFPLESNSNSHFPALMVIKTDSLRPPLVRGFALGNKDCIFNLNRNIICMKEACVIGVLITNFKTYAKFRREEHWGKQIRKPTVS
jgi:hypothetical protein